MANLTTLTYTQLAREQSQLDTDIGLYRLALSIGVTHDKAGGDVRVLLNAAELRRDALRAERNRRGYARRKAQQQAVGG